MSKARKVSLLTLALTAALVGAAPSAGAPSLERCSHVWKAPVDGRWSDGANWSRGTAPSAGDIVCIKEPGTYEVTLDENATVRSLTVGGSGHGTPTLRLLAGIAFANVTLSVEAGIDVASDAVVLMTSATEFRSAELHGDVTNAGTLRIDGPVGGRILEGAVTNTGTIDVRTPAQRRGAPAAFVNQGLVTVSDGGELDLADSTTFTNAPGGTVALADTGSLRLLDSTFEHAGGTVPTNHFIELFDSELRLNNKLPGRFSSRGFGTLTGNVGAGQQINVAGRLGASAPFTNAGLIVLTSAEAQSTLAAPGSGLVNTGTVRVGPGAEGVVHGSVLNKGTFDVDATFLYNDATFVNQGAFAIADRADAQFILARFTNSAGGSLVTAGTGQLVLLGSFFDHGDGTVEGPAPISLDRSQLNVTGVNPASFSFTSVNGWSGGLPGTGQVVSLCKAVVDAAEAFTSRGTILKPAGCGVARLVAPGSLLTNLGTVRVEHDPSDISKLEIVTPRLLNTGTVALGAYAVLQASDAFEQAPAGALEIAVGPFGPSFVHAAQAFLDGRLAVDVEPGFKPGLGATFAVVQTPAVTGAFSKVTGAVIAKERYFRPVYSSDGVTLVVTDAELSLSASSGLPGTQVTVTGSGYPAGDTLTLKFKDKRGRTTNFGPVTTDASGAFSKTVQIPQNARVGAGKFSAKSAVTGVTAKKPFAVT